MRELNLEAADINFIGKGISNCGNSCFMNSVNQMLFHIPELREFMIHNENLFKYASDKLKKNGAIHDYDLILKLIGLFKKIKENTVITQIIGENTKIMGDITLEDLYISVQNQYFSDTINYKLKDYGTINDKLGEYDRKTKPIIKHIIELKSEYEKPTTPKKRKNLIKTEILTIINGEDKRHLIETDEQRKLQYEVNELITVSPTDPKIHIILTKLDTLNKQDITRIADNIFDNLLASYISSRNSKYAHQQSASELLLNYLSNGNNNVNIIDNIIYINYDDIIMYNKSNSKYATNHEYIINKINLPFNDFFTKVIEIKFCDNDKNILNKIEYESYIQYKGKLEINLEDVIEKVHQEYCKNKIGDPKNINTTKIIRFIPDKYLLINIGREYEKVFKLKRIIKKINPLQILETIYDNITNKITFIENNTPYTWDESSKKYKLEIEQIPCEEREYNNDTWIIDPDTYDVYLKENIHQLKPNLYKTEQLINNSPISNYDTKKQEMIINYNDGTKDIKYNLIGTICKSGVVDGGHYWYHHKINNLWYQYNDSTLTPNSPPDPQNMLIILLRREGDDYTIPIYENVYDMKLHILKQIKDNVMIYDNELSDDLSKTDKLKEDINRLLYYTNKYGSNTHQVNHELLEINCKFKEKINSILTP